MVQMYIRRLPLSGRSLSPVVRPVLISRKLSRIDPLVIVELTDSSAINGVRRSMLSTYSTVEICWQLSTLDQSVVRWVLGPDAPQNVDNAPYFNALIGTHRIILVYAGRWWVGCYIGYSEEGTGRAAVYRSPYCCKMARCSVTIKGFRLSR